MHTHIHTEVRRSSHFFKHPPALKSPQFFSKTQHCFAFFPTNLHQSSEMLQHTLHRKMQEVVVSQVESSQINSREDSEGEALQQVGVEEQKLQGWHGVERPWIYLADLVIFKVKKPENQEKLSVTAFICLQTEGRLLEWGYECDMVMLVMPPLCSSAYSEMGQ